jgi:hypothetical protein
VQNQPFSYMERTLCSRVHGNEVKKPDALYYAVALAHIHLKANLFFITTEDTLGYEP